jgi:type IV pilus assembly protein PilV
MPGMKTQHPANKRDTQAGMTLIEVLVAILIFSFGLIGLIGLQARAVQFSTSAEDTSRAALLANEIAASISTTTISGTAVSVSASAAEAWQARAADASSGGLPNGSAAIAASGNAATITITWRAPSAASGAANAVNQYVTQVVIP